MTEKQKEALRQLKQDDSLFCDVADIADIMESNPQDIRDQAQRNVHQLGYKAVVVNSRVKIPREEFLRWLGV